MTIRAGFEIASFTPERGGAEAAVLAAQAVTALRDQIPLLPERWTRPEAFETRLTDLVARNPAVLALVDGTVAGYMAGMRLDWSQGRWAFSPEWANLATGPVAGRMREDMYAALAEQWIADDRRAHFVSLLPTDAVGRETMAWLGFGITNVDGLRALEPSAASLPLDVRRAGPSDMDGVTLLERDLRDHLASTPLFLRYPPFDPAELAENLADERVATLMATDHRGPLAMLRIGPASSDASTIIRDEGTASITRAFTRADRRGEGVAATLLNAALEWARAEGYRRCAVDFESANLLAARYWPRHFEIVGVTVGRRL